MTTAWGQLVGSKILANPVLARVTRLLGADRIAGFTDQTLFTLVTMSQMFIYAKLLHPQEFGVFAMIQAICLISQGVQRAVCVLPMIITATGDGVDRQWSRFDVVIRVTVASVLILVAASLYYFTSYMEFARAFSWASLCSVSTLAYEFQRRSLFVQRLAKRVIMVAGIYFVANMAAIAVVALWFRTTEAAAVGLFAGGGIAALSARWVRRPNIDSGARFKDQAGLVAWNLASYASYAVYNNGMVLIVGAVMDVRTVALYSASRLFTAPIQTLLQAIDSVDKPRARRMYVANGLEGLSKSLRRTRLGLLALGVPYLVLVAVFAGPLTHYLFNDRFPHMEAAVQMWALVALLMLLSQPIETGLSILRKVNLFFWTRTVAALTTVTMLLVLAKMMPGTAPMLALALGWGAGGLLAGLLLHHYLKAPQG